jgi:hypothetical protein
MGLLDLLLQNQSNLDINPVPQQGNGPVSPATGEFNTGVTQFQQVWDSNNTYVNSFTGGTNVGIQPPTLKETGLDVDNPNFIPSTTTPNTLTVYPATALGGLGQSAVQFLQIWSPVINYNDVVVGAPTSPLAQSLPETGLDNTDVNAVPTTVSPINTTDYPNLATGEYNSVSNQYSQVYGPNNTYLNTYDPNVQPNSLDETGLDVENIGLVSTTAAPSPNTSYPSLASGEFGGKSDNFNQIYTPTKTYLDTFNSQTQPNTIIQGQTGLDNINPVSAPTTTTPSTPTSYPNQSTGEFGGASSQYNTPYGPNNTYENAYVNNPVNFDTLQPTTLDETGLDNTNSSAAPTTTTPVDPTQYPQFTQGEFNSAPNLYNQVWGPTNQYIINYNPNIQPDTIIQGQTGLDNINPTSAPTTTVPNTPTNYPNQSTGEFGGVSSQYSSPYGPNSTYENNYVNNVINFDTLQTNTLDETGLDNTNSTSAPTTTTPVDPTAYPQYAQGEFNGAPILYNQTWGPNFGYLANYNPNIQPSTLGQTGLDNTNTSFTLTTTAPDTITVYPQLALGEFNSVSTQYFQTWGPNNQYIINYNPNTQPNTLDETGLDIENSNALPTTTTPSTVTQYPQFVQGEFNTAPNQYSQVWGPTNQYVINYNPNIQPNTVLGGETGLDNTNLLAFNTTFVPNTITAPTNYPQPAQTYLGEFQGAPSQFTPLYNPNPGQSYLDNYNTIISNAGNQQINTLGQTDLDNSNSNSSPLTVQNIDPTVYPLFVQGEFQGAPNLFSQIWGPGFGYYLNSNPSAQTNTLSQTGLDIEDINKVTTTTSPNTITVYPVEATGELGSAPSQYQQEWIPTNKYYNFMKENYEAR